MGASCDLTEILIFYYNFPIGPHFSDKLKEKWGPIGPHFSDKLKVSHLDLKLYPQEGLYHTSLHTKFENFWIKSEILVCWQKGAFLWILCYA